MSIALPKVTVVTPSFNQGRFIEETIESVLMQDYPQKEFIIVDGGSTDETPRVLARYQSSIDKIIVEPDNGQSDAINKGFRHASGSLVGWLNSDDTLLPDAIGLVVDCYQTHPEGVLFYGDIAVVDSIGTNLRLIRPSARLTYSQLVGGRGVISQPGSFHARAAVERAGMLRQDYYITMDRDLWLRTLRYGDGWHVGGTVARFRVHPAAKSSQPPFIYLKEILRLESEHPSPLISRRKVQLLRAALRCALARLRSRSVAQPLS